MESGARTLSLNPHEEVKLYQHLTTAFSRE
jgi:hypothetical protein